MKKIIFLGLILTLVAGAASAQVQRGDRFRREKTMQSFRRGDLNRAELYRLHHDEMRFKSARRRANRDGVVSPFERRHLRAMKKHDRREYFRFKHNRHRRVI
jgi:hypothetical protein